ncbi:MAG: hypothetical protein MJ231_04655 [bacterium]|nr:hypothetical protein [bacterium]
MNIQSYNQFQNLNFNGLYKLQNVITKESGKQYYNKVVQRSYNIVYHPFENESAEFIKEQIDKLIKGRTFTLWEKDHGHIEGLYYHVNNVSEGAKIRQEDTEKLIKAGYSKSPKGMPSESVFYNMYNNESYATMDVLDLSKKRILEIVKAISHR